MRADALQHKGRTDPMAYEESVKLGNEVATILRRNFVQAHRVASDDDERWSECPLFFVVHLPDLLSRNPDYGAHRDWE
jgi:hypothetical protein